MLRAFRGLSRTQLLLVLVAGTLPVVHSLLLFRSFTVPQLALLIAALAMLLAAGIMGSARWIKSEPPTVKLALAALLGFFVLSAVSAAQGADPIRSISGHPFQGTGLVFWAATIGLFIAALRFRSELMEPVITAVLASGALLVALVGLWFAGPDVVEEFLVPFKTIPLPGVGNSAMLAGFSAMTALLALGRAAGRPKWGRWLLLASLLAALLVLCQSRVSTVAFAAAVLAGLGFSLRRGTKAFRVAVILVALVASGAGALSIESSLRSKAPGADDNIHMPTSAKFQTEAVLAGAKLRDVLWEVAVRTTAHNPALGVGPSNFSYAYRQYATDEDVRATGRPEIENNDAHNLFLEVAATTGIPAAALLLAGIAAAAMSLEAGSSSKPGATWVRLGAGVLIATLLFQPLSLVLLPILAILGGAAAKGPPVQSKPAPAAPRKTWLLVPAAALVLAGIGAGAALIYSDFLFRTGSLEWRREDLKAAAALDPACQPCLYQLGMVRAWDHRKEEVGTPDWALRPYRKAVSEHPLDSEAYTRLGGGLLFLDRPDEAVKALSRARQLDPHSPLAARGLAVAYLRTGQPGKAVPAAKDLAELVPTAASYRFLAEVADAANLPKLAADAREQVEALEKPAKEGATGSGRV